MFMSGALICSLAQVRRVFHVRVQILLPDFFFFFWGGGVGAGCFVFFVFFYAMRADRRATRTRGHGLNRCHLRNPRFAKVSFDARLSLF